ncbi:hypothetical protein [Metabacillus idriensis]|uniref:hypothetical protein n=1 Tax=Metabacillus idriensis TaxID=324768 RepID=UPI00174BFC78|nr:hypothetical protein [Metabacillus idriensis]
MPKVYKPIFHFKDGKSWGADDLGLDWTTVHISSTLEQLEVSDKIELTSIATGEKRTVSEIKSIEITF